ncbi:carbamoyltransferase N-terminal domain-containing protein [Chitinophagaceae bacterium 26-R-25]|nr:carbamoyltransferase N-terminal domain-containing protein [Chitinophagaceae bacterium 26-R-25]
MPSIVLGISAFYHDSAAVLLIDNEIIAAAQEERFTRIKNDSAFPVNAIQFVLAEAGVDGNDLSAVAFYEKPLLKFERLLETIHSVVPQGAFSFIKAMPMWFKEKLFIKQIIRKELKKLGARKDLLILFPEHHLSHAASAYYPSPFSEAAVVTIDGVGEWTTTSIGYAKGNNITILKEQHFPHSIGLLYSAFTYFLGFKVNSGEYKVMGLAPYGDILNEQTVSYIDKIKTVLIDIRNDGSYLLNMHYFAFASELKMIHVKKWEKLFGIEKRKPETELLQAHKNLARAIQEVLNDIIIMLAQTARQLTGSNQLVLAGGVALNCVANARIIEEGIFSDVWVQPAAGDAGGALGAAYAAANIWFKQPDRKSGACDAMKGCQLGPHYDTAAIKKLIAPFGAAYKYYNDFNELTRFIAKEISKGKIIGWFQGKMEFGPRALGNRSILADAFSADMQSILNVRIKQRESFRPFAPAVIENDTHLYFNATRPSRHMSFTFKQLDKISAPAVIHVDGSARIQTVNKNVHSRLFQLLEAYKQETGHSLFINTSFNQRGEPIVCTPKDAYLAFMQMKLDWLVMGDFVFDYTLQPENNGPKERKFEAD